MQAQGAELRTESVCVVGFKIKLFNNNSVVLMWRAF